MNKWIAIVGVIVAASVTVMVSSLNKSESQQQMVDALDSATILLDSKVMPSNDYIILYSTAPKIISSGSVIAKLPCDEDSEPKGWILIGGVGTNLSKMKLELIQGSPGSMCAYIANIPNETAPDISGVVMVNTTSEPFRLPRTSSVVVTVQGVSAP